MRREIRSVEKFRAGRQAHRQKRIDAGLCAQCGRHPRGTGTRCLACREIHGIWSATKHVAHGESQSSSLLPWSHQEFIEGRDFRPGEDVVDHRVPLSAAIDNAGEIRRGLLASLIGLGNLRGTTHHGNGAKRRHDLFLTKLARLLHPCIADDELVLRILVHAYWTKCRGKKNPNDWRDEPICRQGELFGIQRDLPPDRGDTPIPKWPKIQGLLFAEVGSE